MVRIPTCILAASLAAVACGGSDDGSSGSRSAASGGTTISGAGTSSGGGGGGGSTAGAGSGGSGSGSTAGAGGGGGAASGGRAGSGGGASTAGASSGGAPPTSEGIAAAYPGDVGIEGHPAVLFADDFESYSAPSELNGRWDAVYQNQLVRLTTEASNVYAGAQALQFDMPIQTAEISDATDKLLSPEQDVLHLRYYSKFISPFDVVGSSHNGSSISAHYFENGQATPGVPADGTNKFLVALENWRGEAAVPSPGVLNLYVYHPEQRDVYGDHWFTTGLVSPNTSLPYDFGADFIPHEDIIQDLDRWYCYEYRVKANTPGERDGEVVIWLDGQEVAAFRDLRFRDAASLKIDRFGLSLHIHDNPNGETKYFDNVVAATEYIGPMAQP